MEINLLIAKVKVQFEYCHKIQNISAAHTIIVELCAVRDGVANCDVLYGAP